MREIDSRAERIARRVFRFGAGIYIRKTRGMDVIIQRGGGRAHI